jgi:hypothetical protein
VSSHNQNWNFGNIIDAGNYNNIVNNDPRLMQSNLNLKNENSKNNSKFLTKKTDKLRIHFSTNRTKVRKESISKLKFLNNIFIKKFLIRW